MFEPKPSMTAAEETRKFHDKIDEITGIVIDVHKDGTVNQCRPQQVAASSADQTLLYVDKNAILNTRSRLRQVALEMQDKVDQCDAELEQLLAEIKHEYLHKAIQSRTFEEVKNTVVGAYNQITRK